MEDGSNNDNNAPEEVKVNIGNDLKTEVEELEQLSEEVQTDFSAAPETGDRKEESVPVSRSTNKTHVYKNRAFYAFRYVAMLLTGVGFLSSLINIIAITISKLVNEDFYVSTWAGSFYANLATAVIILGIAHLLLSFTVGKNWEPEDGEERKYPTVLSVIYSVGLGVAAMSFLVVFMGTLFGSMLGLNNATGTEILEQFLISFVAILILCFALIYKLNLFAKMAKVVYVAIMGVVAMVGVILFLVFPATDIRNTLHDDNVTGDLYKIEDALEEYYGKNGSLPKALAELTFEKDELHYKVNTYEYSVVENEYSSRYGSTEYKICAEFKTNTKDNEETYYRSASYAFSYHGEGKECFERSVYGGYYPVNDYSSSSLDSNSYSWSDSDDYDDTELKCDPEYEKCADDDATDSFNWDTLLEDESSDSLVQ